MPDNATAQPLVILSRLWYTLHEKRAIGQPFRKVGFFLLSQDQEAKPPTMTDLSLRILLEAQDSATSIVKNLGGAIAQIASGNVLGGVATVAATAAGAVVGFGVASVKAAGDFQQMSNTLVTSAGESQRNLAMVRSGILDISVSTATSTDQLVKAMYQIESSGKHGSDGLLVLKTAAQGAKAENADLEVVAKALTTVLTDYHLSASQSTSAMNGLIATVSSGKTTLQELSGSMGAVLPIASALHVSFPQVAGALATMTNAGMSARQAAQNLAHVLLSLESPTDVSVKSMMAVGLSAQQVKDALVHQGLPEALAMIEDHVGKVFPESSVQYETALKNIVGGQVGFKLAAMLTGQSLKDTEANIKNVTLAMQQGGSTVAGFDVVQQSFNFRLEQAKQAWNALLIQVGTLLLPVLTQLMEKVTPLIIAFTNWATSSNTVSSVMHGFNTVMAVVNTIVKQAGAILVPMLVQAWTSLQQSLAPIMPELRIFAQVVGVIVVASILQFAKVFGGLVQILGGAIQVIANLIAFFVDVFTGHFEKLGPDLQGIWNGIIQMLRGLWNALSADAVNWGRNLMQGFINGFVSMIASLGNASINAMNIVRNFLGFHSPAKEGPGAEADMWGPNLIKTFSSGMVSALPQLSAAVSVTAGQLSPLSSARGAAGGAGTGTGVTNYFTINIDGRSKRTDQDLVDTLINEISRRTRSSGNFVTWTSGGKA